MRTEHLFAREDVLPSWWANAIGKFLSLSASGFQVLKRDATHIEVVAGADAAAAVIAVQGRWRWVETTITRAHPGGPAGTYDVFVTATENDIEPTPAPYTDATNYAFALAIVTAGSSPPIVPGAVDLVEKVGSLQWDGAQITRVDQSFPMIPRHAHSHASGQPDVIAPADIGAAPAPALVTALPGSPFDGQIIDFLVDDGVVWRFRYRAASGSAFKWEFIGGPPLVDSANVANHITAGAFAPLPNDVSINLPGLPTGGDFDITVMAELSLAIIDATSNTPSSGTVRLGFASTGVAASVPDAASIEIDPLYRAPTSSNIFGVMASLTTRATGIHGTVNLQALVASMVNANAYVNNPRLLILPVRVG